MRKTNRICSLCAALVAPMLWSLPAASMMGGDGPPPCESRACFVEAVSACKEKASYMTTTAAGARAQYVVEGPADDGRCQVGMIYMTHPQSDWTYKPLHFVLERDGDIETRLKETVADCLAGRADGNRQCSGPLLEISGAASNQ
ncbi:MAG: hypothetical protein U5K43_00725 [Halofilum sp. (in: g-proteobacteria)]|nr:hypothetical protein [Halofilum sp. (in: g-proteobacteria)]